MLDAIPSWHLNNDHLIRQEFNWKIAVRWIDAPFRLRNIWIKVSWLVDIENSVDVILHKVIVAVEDVVIVPIAHHLVSRDLENFIWM